MPIIKETRVGAYAVIIKDDKIALVKKANGGYKGKYDLPGGKIEHYETPEEALHRECMEELAATAIQEQLLDVASITFTWQIKEDLSEDLHHIGILYQASIKETQLKKDYDGKDSLGGLWLKITDLKEEEVTPFTWHALKILRYK